MSRANHRATEEIHDQEDLRTSALEEVAEAVSVCLANKESLDRTLSSLRAAQLQGEPVQSDLNDVFDRFPALVTVATLEAQDQLLELIERAVTKDMLPEGVKSKFVTWWGDKRWIADGVGQFESTRRCHPPAAWSNTELDAHLGGDELIIEHVMQRGVDEVHRIQAPASILAQEGAWRVEQSLTRLVKALDAGALELDEVDERYLAETETLLEEALATLDDLPIDGQGGDDASNDRDESDESETTEDDTTGTDSTAEGDDGEATDEPESLADLFDGEDPETDEPGFATRGFE